MQQKHIHLIGIGGISMSGIAEILLHKGYKVSGSDLKDNHLLDYLREQGGKIYIGHSTGNVEGADLVVISNAVPQENVELKYARENNIPVIERAQMIARFMEDKYNIAISGTHGKTTTTSMIASVLKTSDRDPTILVGGELDEIGGNVHIGKDDYFITEADESDGSFLYFDPELAIITNVELDHIDYYDSHEKLLSTFRKFLTNVSDKGIAVLCAEDEILRQIIDEKDLNALTYGFKQGGIRAKNIQLLPFGSYFTIFYNQQKLGEVNLQIPGKYNILNSLAAVAAGMYLGLSFTSIKKALEGFAGVGRRFEKKGLIGDILVVDDYAHHPTEIKNTLEAASNTGYERIVAVFQPHRFTRTKYLFEEFSRSFDLVDHLIITDIYSAGEQPVSDVKAEDLVHLIARDRGIKVDYISDLNDIVDYLKNILQPRDLVLTIGAGDVYKVGELLLDEMKKFREMA